MTCQSSGKCAVRGSVGCPSVTTSNYVCLCVSVWNVCVFVKLGDSGLGSSQDV